MKWETGELFKTSDRIEGMVRVVAPLSHIRITWKKPEWKSSSTLQLRMIKSKDRTTISFHQDRLAGEEQRAEMLAHWESVLDKLETNLAV